MCLLDSIESWDAGGIRCRAVGHRLPNHPLRRNGRLPALYLVEYAAQAVAAHGSLLEGVGTEQAVRGGVLAALRELVLCVDELDNVGPELQVAAVRRVAGPGGVVYSFDVRAGDGALLASGRLSVMSIR